MQKRRGTDHSVVQQQAIWSSFIAAFGVDILPQSYQLNEEPGQEDAAADGSESEELPHLLSEDTLINPLPDHVVTDDDAQWNLAVPQPLSSPVLGHGPDHNLAYFHP